jgi:hypothetical protein
VSQKTQNNSPTDELTHRLNTRSERDAMLLALDARWPDPPLVGAYRQAAADLVKELTSRAAESWPNTLARFFNERVRERLLSVEGDDLAAVRRTLRQMSGLGAMLMHMEVVRNATNILGIGNGRRTRTEYATYPTSPRVAAAMASYVWNCILSQTHRKSGSFRIMDPTMEGGPTLLELAFQACRHARFQAPNGRGCSRMRNFVLSGVDQNPAAARIVSTLLEAWRTCSKLNIMHLDIRCQDAFEALSEGEPLHAVVNNPPWGARTDGADGQRLFPLGPYMGYRDPYIAFVSLGLKQLQPGGPFAFVLPLQLLTATSAGKLRQEILENGQIESIVLLPRTAFPRATIRTAMLLGRRRRDGERRREIQVVRYPMTRRISDRSSPAVVRLDVKSVQDLDLPPWMSVVQSEPPFVPQSPVRPLGDIAKVVLGLEPYRLGRGRPKQTSSHLRGRPFTFERPGSGTTPVARSRDIARFCVGSVTEFLRIGPWLAAPGSHLRLAHGPRIFVRQICGRDGSLVAAAAPFGTVARYGVFTIVGKRIAPDVLCALLNSNAAGRYVRSHCAGYHKESFNRVSAEDLRNFPTPLALIEGEGGATTALLRAEIKRLVARAVSAIKQGERPALERTTSEIDRLINLVFGWRPPIFDSLGDASKPLRGRGLEWHDGGHR